MPNNCGRFRSDNYKQQTEEEKKKKDVKVKKIYSTSVFARLEEEQRRPRPYPSSHPLTSQDALFPSPTMKLQTACKKCAD